MTNQTKIKLDNLLGKTFLYQTKAHTFVEIKALSTGKIALKTKEERTVVIMESDVDHFISELKPYTISSYRPPLTLATKKNDFIFVAPSENEEIKQSLLDVLKELKEGTPTKQIIAKSNAIVNVTDAMINMQKSEIAFYKLQKQLHR